jgi:hypothetical protein
VSNVTKTQEGSFRLRIALATVLVSFAGVMFFVGGRPAVAGPTAGTSPRAWANRDLRQPTRAELVRAMTRLSLVCGFAPGGPTATGVVLQAANAGKIPAHEATVYACLLGAPDGATCAELQECWGYTQGGSPNEPFCDGSLLRSSVSHRESQTRAPAAIACHAFGETCFSSLAGAFCGIEPCAAGETYSCDGDSLFGCFQGVRMRTECGRGMTCGASAGSGILDCVGTGAACSGGARCDGNVLMNCPTDGFGKGREQPLDCGAYGLVCRSGSGQAVCSPPPLAAENCGDNADPTCEGGKLKVCVARRWETLACLDIGLTGSCASSTSETMVECK